MQHTTSTTTHHHHHHHPTHPQHIHKHKHPPPHTEHWVFRGPGFELAQEVGDAGHGGQILLTHWAWDQLRSCMDTARFPCVRQLGLYCAASSAVPIWLYEVQQLLGRPLRRVFGPLTGLKQVHPGFGYQITPAPVPEREVCVWWC